MTDEPTAGAGADPARREGEPAGEETRAVQCARLRGKRTGNAILVALAFAFIGASALQIIPAVFGAGAPAVISPGPAAAPETVCSRGLLALLRSLDRASGSAWISANGLASDGDHAALLQAFQRGLMPEWEAPDSVAEACARSSAGSDAWAALLRLRRAHEQVLLRDRLELVPVRHDVTSHLAAELR